LSLSALLPDGLPAPLVGAAEGAFTGEYLPAAAGSPVDLAWLIPVVPALSALFLLIFGKRLGAASAWVAITAIGYSAVASTLVFLHLLGLDSAERSIIRPVASWLEVGSLTVEWAVLVDPLSSVMLLLVTWVGLLIHVYSLGYMHGDERYSRFFAYLNLFAASMLVLVLGESLLTLFVGWELVGLCSYLLVGFWFENRDYASAAKKAFVVNRVGDVGFMLAMFATFAAVGSLSFAEVLPAAEEIAAGSAVAITLLLFLAVTGKSAQVPLFVWLPDAMAGPTPVSALIHAATMVTAGVYLLARTSPLLAHAVQVASFDVGLFGAYVGAVTALIAALIACTQNDLKKILAYSTISQLGYMVMGASIGSPASGIFHVLTHGFFKALLFLAAGSVMHALANETDIWRMGGLAKAMPVTFAASVVGWLAISGLPPFSGFYSKEEILAAALGTPGAQGIWIIGAFVAGLTAFYMSRWFFLIFLGSSRMESHQRPHESPLSMTLPLGVLAAASAVGGLIGVTGNSILRFWELDAGWLFTYLAPSVVPYSGEAPFVNETAAGLIVTAAALIGIASAARLYLRPGVDHAALRESLGGVYRLPAGKFYVDEIYDHSVAAGGRALMRGSAFIDTRIVDGAVNGLASGTGRLAGFGRRVQTGFVRSYALGILIGTVVVTLTLVGGAFFLGQG
jgi:NADH-quinone oxidoreductase subunit L